MTTARRIESATHPIGWVASAAGVSVTTVRYYDELGLITAEGRVGGKRRFSAETVDRVGFIRRAQQAGFSLEEIGTILDDDDRGWANLVETKIAELQQRRDELNRLIDQLHAVSHCTCRRVQDCVELHR